MPNPPRMVAVILLLAAVIGLSEPAAQTAISAGRGAFQVTTEGIGWD